MVGIIIKDGVVKGGTIAEIVHYLIDQNAVPNSPHRTSLEQFLAAFPEVTTTMDVWNVLVEKFNTSPPLGQLRRNSMEQPRKEPRDKVLEFLWIWIEQEVSRDFILKKNKQLMNELLKFLPNCGKDWENKIKLLVVKSGRKKLTTAKKYARTRTASADSPAINNKPDNNNTRRGKNPVEKPKQPEPPKTPDVSRKTLGLEAGKFEFHDLDPELVAQQLTLIEYETFVSIEGSEFLHLNWKSEDVKQRKKLAPHIVKLVERFNLVSYWVATEIVMQTDAKQREKTVRKFISVAEHLRELNNFNGVMEIIGGLNLWPVQRLKQTWEEIGSAKSTIDKLDNLMENKQNYKVYRYALAGAKAPLLPYLGVCLRDMLFVEEGNNNYIDKKEGILNFEKLQLMGSVILQVRQFQQERYLFQYETVVQDFLSKLNTLPEEMLSKHSYFCEPSRTEEHL